MSLSISRTCRAYLVPENRAACISSLQRSAPHLDIEAKWEPSASAAPALPSVIVCPPTGERLDLRLPVPPPLEPFSGGRAEISPGIFLVTLVGAPSPGEFDGFLEDMALWLGAIRVAGQKVALVVDPSALTRFDAPMRSSYGNWRAAQRDLIRASVTRAAYVTHDAMWRGIMTAVFWFARPAIPVELCESRQSALDWLRAKAASDS